LIEKSDLVGVLTLYSSNRDGFTADHERILEIVSRQVATVLRHATEFQTEKAHSLRDQLTGLPNIEQFVQFSKSAQHGGGPITPAALLLIDVDNLKQINDEFGHRTGDAVLSHVVDSTRRMLRTSDVLFRNDGDQFIAVLLHTAEATAHALAERLAAAVRDSRGEFAFDVTVATAVATAPRDAGTFEGLLDAARHRMTSRFPPTEGNRNNDRIH